MRTLFIAVAAFSLAAAGQGFAQQGHDDHHAASATPPAATATDPANPTHADCKALMGRKMDGKAMHNHGADKGAPVVGRTQPLSDAEMAKMHETCAAKMAKADKPAK